MNTGFCGWKIILRINGIHGINGSNRMKYEEIPWLRLGLVEGGLWPWCHRAPFVIPLLDRGIHVSAFMAGSSLIPAPFALPRDS